MKGSEAAEYWIMDCTFWRSCVPGFHLGRLILTLPFWGMGSAGTIENWTPVMSPAFVEPTDWMVIARLPGVVATAKRAVDCPMTPLVPLST